MMMVIIIVVVVVVVGSAAAAAAAASDGNLVIEFVEYVMREKNANKTPLLVTDSY